MTPAPSVVSSTCLLRTRELTFPAWWISCLTQRVSSPSAYWSGPSSLQQMNSGLIRFITTLVRLHCFAVVVVLRCTQLFLLYFFLHTVQGGLRAVHCGVCSTTSHCRIVEVNTAVCPMLRYFGWLTPDTLSKPANHKRGTNQLSHGSAARV